MRITDNLEHLLLSAVVQGHADLKKLRRDELSRAGQQVYDGLMRLSKKHSPPYKQTVVLAAATDVAGGDPDVIRPFLHKVYDAGGGAEAGDLLTAVHEKQLLLDLVNLASSQMADGGLNRQAFLEKLGTKQANTLNPVSANFKGKEKWVMPEGIPLPDLPRIQKATHGLYGTWVLSGDAGVGKSTLALELAIQAGRYRPVLVYDYENGQPVLLAHLSQAFNSNNNKIREATKQVYFRDSIQTLDNDLSSVGKPCLVVVDSLQKVPVRGSEDKRVGVEGYVHKLEALKLQGHCVLMISEKNRTFYGRTGQAGYKETGSIEYAVDVGMELLEVKETQGLVEVSINKNRNWPDKNYICTIQRVNNWWFREVGSNDRR